MARRVRPDRRPNPPRPKATSASARPHSRLRPRRWSTWALRTRLLVTTTVMLALVSAVIVLVTTVALRAHLEGDLQQKVVQQADGATGSRIPGDLHGGAPGFAGGGPLGQGLEGGDGNSDSNGGGGAFQQPNVGFVNSAFSRSGRSVGLWLRQGQVLASGRTVTDSTRFTPDAAVPALTSAQIAALRTVPDDGSAHSVTLPGLGDYLVMVKHPDFVSLSEQSAAPYLVSGLSENDIESLISRLVMTEIVVAVLGVVVTGVLSVVVIRLSLRPLDRVAATAARISRLPLDKGEVGELVKVPAADTDPRTETGLVGTSLNHMIDHVSAALAARHASETKVRQFVADASHELRTPLASIRGYAELTRRGRDTVPPDTAYALGRIEAEAARMTGMVEDLLLLARLDAGRPLDQGPVDVTPLVVDAVRDAHAAGPDHVWRIDVPEDPVVVTGDQDRLRQVLVNLLANAARHTPEGTEVTASVAVEDGWARLRVADDGPGIPETQLPTVFERFARGDSSRSRAAGSTGLGLAIVSAVVGSHRGVVSVDSRTATPTRPGATTFTVRLPLASTSPATAPTSN